MANKTFLPSAPTRNLWLAATIIGGLGILAHYVHINQLSKYNFELLLIGFILLVIGTAYRKI